MWLLSTNYNVSILSESQRLYQYLNLKKHCCNSYDLINKSAPKIKINLFCISMSFTSILDLVLHLFAVINAIFEITQFLMLSFGYCKVLFYILACLQIHQVININLYSVSLYGEKYSILCNNSLHISYYLCNLCNKQPLSKVNVMWTLIFFYIRSI